MIISDAIKGSGIPWEDAEILLARILAKDRTWVFGHAGDDLPADAWATLQTQIDRRKKFEPVAYILGEQEFFGRNFTVDARALIPRPSTEGLVQLVLDFLKTERDKVRAVEHHIIAVSKKIGALSDVRTIVDIGTGSGCIAVTLALELPHYKIIATDVSHEALSLAKENAERHGVSGRIEFREGSGTAPLQDLSEPFLLVSNPPYIPSGRTLMPDVQNFEPHLALFGGTDGADLLRDIVQFCTNHPRCRGYAVECGEEQKAFF
ncbi:MAG TPA: peptide chain release factor N(5)-glutamine methyltransferase [Candidatus Peribacteraceae bacterium]|nr:peptide chain release factor N(5)-glutamine methyltransferase [Candidatus Peribacteraceae bacterium]